MRILRFMTLAAILSLLIAVPSMCAVNSITLKPATELGLTGAATAISGSFGGATPHTRVEINAKLDMMPAADHVYEGWLVDSKNNVRQNLGVFRGDRLMSMISLTNWAPNSTWTSFEVSLEPANSTNQEPTTVVATGSLPGSTVSTDDFARVAILPPDETFQRQLVAQQFELTADQVINLRAMGLGYREITLAANISKQCKEPINQVAETYMKEGGDLEKVASAFKTSVMAMTTVAPFTAVAGSMQETGESYTLMSDEASSANTYPTGMPVLSYDQWQNYSNLGYAWIDVAAAANIAARTKDNMDDLLRMAKVQGMFWHDIAVSQGVDSDRALDMGGWTWERKGRSFSITDTERRTIMGTPHVRKIPHTRTEKYKTETSTPGITSPNYAPDMGEEY